MTAKEEQNSGPTPQRIMQFAWGYAGTLIVDTAVRLRLFDMLEQGPKTATELAQSTNSSLRGMTALLNALVGLEFLSRAGERYAVTPESSAFLVSTKPSYHGAFFEH